MKTNRTDSEIIQLKDILQNDRTFIRVFNDNWTQKVMNDLKGKMYGKIPRNFLVNIGGLVGSVTGIFKSTLGLQVALELDPYFNLKQRVAFSINELLNKVKNNTEYVLCNVCYYNFIRDFKGTFEEYEKTGQKCENCDNMADKLILLTKLIFFLDEQTRTLKTGGIVRLQNLVDTCRQRQICFVCCGVEQYDMSFTTYSFKRIQESHDNYLPKKRVRYGVYDDVRRIYYGYFQWDITPLTDEHWSKFWKEYSVMKTDFQRVAISQRTQSQNYEEYAQEIIDSEDFIKCFKITKRGNKIMQSSLVRNLIYKRYPDLTGEDRDNILAEIKLVLYEDDEI